MNVHEEEELRSPKKIIIDDVINKVELTSKFTKMRAVHTDVYYNFFVTNWYTDYKTIYI